MATKNDNQEFFDKLKKIESKLTVRQKLFCHYYIATDKMTESAVHAGYSGKKANSAAHRILTLPHVQEYLALLKLQGDTIVAPDWLLMSLKTEFENARDEGQHGVAARLLELLCRHAPALTAATGGTFAPDKGTNKSKNVRKSAVELDLREVEIKEELKLIKEARAAGHAIIGYKDPTAA